MADEVTDSLSHPVQDRGGAAVAEACWRLRPAGAGSECHPRNTMDDYSTSYLRQYLMEEDDDDNLFSSDDDEAAFVAYSQLYKAENSTRHRRRRSDAPPKVIRPRDLPSGHRRIKADYFGDNPVYNDSQFRRRFRMQRPLFKRIKQAVKNHDSYFKKKVDACGKEGLSALQKCVAAIRILAYGKPTLSDIQLSVVRGLT